jgi:hypothetical protein
VLRILGPKRDQVTGGWRKFHNKELNDLYLPTILRVIKSRRMKWAGHIARMAREGAYTGFWWGNLRERDYWGDSGVGERIILRWILRKLDGVMDWFELAQDRDRRRAFVNAVMNLRVP